MRVPIAVAVLSDALILAAGDRHDELVCGDSQFTIPSYEGIMQRALASIRGFGQLQAGSAATEYALLLAVIACSVLFGARLIMTSELSAVGKLIPGGDVPSVAANHPTPPPQGMGNPPQFEPVDGSARSPVAVQIGALATLLILGAVAAGALLKTCHRLESELQSAAPNRHSIVRNRNDSRKNGRKFIACYPAV